MTEVILGEMARNAVVVPGVSAHNIKNGSSYVVGVFGGKYLTTRLAAFFGRASKPAVLVQFGRLRWREQRTPYFMYFRVLS